MPDQVPGNVRRQRGAALRALLAESSRRYRGRFVGTEAEVLWEATDAYGPDGWRLHGLTGNYLRVTAQSPERLWNQISCVRLTGLNEDGLDGVVTARAAD
jgi:tRNA A37 methylthiotransferase MiaB